MSDGIACMWMRGGTSKGGFFLAADLPPDPAARNAILSRAMGSPDPAQIDGMGGGHPLSSKVAIVSVSDRPGADLDYYFLQVFPDSGLVADDQNCGNLLAGVVPFAIERGLIALTDPMTKARVFMVNTGRIAEIDVVTPGGVLRYGPATGPDSGARVEVAFHDIAGSKCGALLPTGHAADEIDGLSCTLIDNGMPCVILAASDLGVSGYEDPEALESNAGLRQRLERIRLEAGVRMALGDVTAKPIPKMMIVAPPRADGALTVRSFIPHHVHKAVGALAAVTVATAALIPGTVAHPLARNGRGDRRRMSIEHPSGAMACILALDERGAVVGAALERSARKLMDGIIFD